MERELIVLIMPNNGVSIMHRIQHTVTLLIIRPYVTTFRTPLETGVTFCLSQ